MENKNIIIILVAIVIVLAAVLGAMFLQSANAKEPTKLKITSDKTQYEGGKLSIQLTDQNKTAISKEKINITITNKKGKVVLNETVKTNSKGKANLDLNLENGKYNVTVTFAGNENFTASNTTQKLTVEVKAAEIQATSSSSDSSSNSESSSASQSSSEYDIDNLPPTNDPYPETKRYYLDENYVKQEYADGYMRTVDVRTGEVYSLGFK